MMIYIKYGFICIFNLGTDSFIEFDIPFERIFNFFFFFFSLSKSEHQIRVYVSSNISKEIYALNLPVAGALTI